MKKISILILVLFAYSFSTKNVNAQSQDPITCDCDLPDTFTEIPTDEQLNGPCRVSSYIYGVIMNITCFVPYTSGSMCGEMVTTEFVYFLGAYRKVDSISDHYCLE